MTKTIKEFKSEIKTLAQEIKNLKAEARRLFKERDFSNGNRTYAKAKYNGMVFRHKHVAYCLLRGRSLQEIERSWHTPLDRGRLLKELKGYIELTTELQEKIRDAKNVCLSEQELAGLSGDRSGVSCGGGISSVQ